MRPPPPTYRSSAAPAQCKNPISFLASISGKFRLSFYRPFTTTLYNEKNYGKRIKDKKYFILYPRHLHALAAMLNRKIKAISA